MLFMRLLLIALLPALFGGGMLYKNLGDIMRKA
jgi:hypothetical protein